MVFTSGSTGKPKAILGSHQGLAHFICWQSREFGITPHDRFAQLTAVGFDVIYRSVLTPLFSGAQLWIPPHDVSEGEAMLEWLGRHRINALSDLRCIFSGGEMLHSKVVQAICRQWAFTGQLVNLYGPSETTLAKCFYRCQSGDKVRGSIPVGLPLPNTEVWIMDGSRRCAPVEPGEVVIRTPYRALGYVNSTGTASWPTANAQKSEDYLYYTRDLGGISHFFLNYPDKVTADWSVALDFYCRQVQDLIQEAPEQPVWLGGWSMGGNIAVAVAERLAGGCPQIRPRLIVLDSLSGYCQGVRQNRDVTEDVWSPYHPENIMYRQFAMAGYSRHPYYHYVDCLRHLDAMQVTHCHYPVLLIKCLEPIGQFYSDMPDNYWGKLPTVSWCTASQLTTTACSLIRLTFIRWPTLYAAHWTMVANMAINTTLRHIDGD